jgi:3-phenylpropionate/cinnamic acid dioxygenase small subunit
MAADSFPEDGSVRKMATLRHVSVGSSIGYAIHEYYVQEAMLLDQMQYADWATLLAPDLKYLCPAPLLPSVTTTPGETVERDRSYLLRHLRSSPAAERARNAPSVRRLITNILVSGGISPKEYTVKTYALITGTWGASGSSFMVTAERHDTLRRCSYTYQIARREVRFGATSGEVLEGIKIL